MKALFSMLMFFCISYSSVSQDKRFSIEANFGLNGNFFVKNRDEQSGPSNKTYFYKKDFIGTIGGVEVNYKVGKRSSVISGYSRSVNSGEKNFSGTVRNVDLLIQDFKIRQFNNTYYIGYKHLVSNGKTNAYIDGGPVLIFTSSQDIMIENWDSFIFLDESNYQNDQSVEGGVFAGFHISRQIDKHFDLGIKIRGYYLISVTTFEMLTLTPTLTYRF